MSYRPYSLFTPPFDPVSGGIRVMWGLYGALLLEGQIVYVNAQYDDNDFIAIYPEIVNGNPLNAKHIVRYILNKPGVMSNGIEKSPTEFDPSDTLYYFSKLFGKTDENHYMFLPILNTFLFKDQGKKRTKTAYFIGKGINNLIHPKDAILIDRQFAQDQQALADLLNGCQVLYCYDPVTAMTELARLCGCRVVVVNSVYSQSDFTNYEPGMDGISWGKDEGVKLNVEGFRNHYLDLKTEFRKKLQLFIEETQS